jgi:hypothetical protein
LREDGVQDRVRDLVRYLIGVAFGHGFRGEKKVIRHFVNSLLSMDGALPASGALANALADLF